MQISNNSWPSEPDLVLKERGALLELGQPEAGAVPHEGLQLQPAGVLQERTEGPGDAEDEGLENTNRLCFVFFCFL